MFSDTLTLEKAINRYVTQNSLVKDKKAIQAKKNYPLTWPEEKGEYPNPNVFFVTAQKKKFSIKGFFSKCDQITEEILLKK